VSKKGTAHQLAKDRSPAEIELLNRAFTQEQSRFNLSYDCRHCVHLNVDTMRCHMEYPNDELLSLAAHHWALNAKGDIAFCKYFEVN
jgi:hypothetical protein